MANYTDYNLFLDSAANGDTYGVVGSPEKIKINGHVEAVAEAVATQADLQALQVSQGVQDGLIALNATKVEVAALQVLVDANIDKAVVSVAREADRSLTVTFDDTTTQSIAASNPTETDPVYTAEKPTLALKSELHDGDAQNVAISANAAAINAEVTRAQAAEALLVPKSAIKSTVRDSANSTDVDVASEKATRTALDLKVDKLDIADTAQVDTGTDPGKIVNVVQLKRKLDALDISGDFIGSADTFAALPTTSSTGQVAANGDWVVLNVTDGVNKRGVYLSDGTNYAFAFELGAEFLKSVIANFTNTDASYSTPLVHSPQVLDEWLDNRQTQTLIQQSGGTFNLRALPNLRQNIRYFIRNASLSQNLVVTYGNVNEYTAEIVNGGTLSTVGDANTDIDIPANSLAYFEYQRGVAIVKISILTGKRFFWLDTPPVAAIEVPFDAQVFIGSSQALFANVTGAYETFTGIETVNWKQINKSEIPHYTTFVEAQAAATNKSGDFTYSALSGVTPIFDAYRWTGAAYEKTTSNIVPVRTPEAVAPAFVAGAQRVIDTFTNQFYISQVIGVGTQTVSVVDSEANLPTSSTHDYIVVDTALQGGDNKRGWFYNNVAYKYASDEFKTLGPYPTVAAAAAEILTVKNGQLNLSADDAGLPKGLYKIKDGILGSPYLLTPDAETPPTPIFLSSTAPVNYFGTYQNEAATAVNLTSGGTIGAAITVTPVAINSPAVATWPHDNPVKSYTWAIDTTGISASEKIWITLEDGDGAFAEVSFNADGTQADNNQAGAPKVTIESSTVAGGVLTVKFRGEVPEFASNPQIKLGQRDTLTAASFHRAWVQTSPLSTPTYVDKFIGQWKGNFALSSGHQILDLGFDLTKCDYVDFVLYDDLSTQWSWHARLEMRSLELRPNKVILDRNAGSFVWARSTTADLSKGQISLADAGNVAQNIGQAVGYKRGVVAGESKVTEITQTIAATPQANARSFAGFFTLNGANQYFIPSVTGTYSIKEQIVDSTNNALFTVVKRRNTGATEYTSFSNRITNANSTNTSTINLFSGNTYEIDVASGGGTTSGSHKVEITLN